MRQIEHQCKLYKKINNLIETSEKQQHSQEKQQLHDKGRDHIIKKKKHRGVLHFSRIDRTPYNTNEANKHRYKTITNSRKKKRTGLQKTKTPFNKR